MNLAPLRWLDEPAGPAIELLDQTRLPAAEVTVTCADIPALVDAIGRLVVRGAPLLGLAGAYGVALAAWRGDDVPAAARALGEARPTAVNLAWGAGLALAAWRAGRPRRGRGGRGAGRGASGSPRRTPRPARPWPSTGCAWSRRAPGC